MSDTPSASREDRVNDAIAEYLRAAGRGIAPQRQDFLAAHPGLEEELTAFLDDRAAVLSAAGPLLAAGPVAGGEVAGYEVLKELGRGGMGVVYRARQRGLGREVALKMVLGGALATPGELARFRREAEDAAALDHPNIVPIYEVGEHQGRPFFAMKLMQGQGLAGKRLPAREAARLGALVARAVHHAHQRGILHRDLKPANVLLDEKGEPHVADFGLARRLDGDQGLSTTGQVVGTLAYLSPEQARGEKGLTVAVDIYGLGAVLYELLTGKPPHQADSLAQTLRLALEAEPAHPRSLDPGIDHDLETVCLKCLAKEPEKRYPSAEAVADDLERWLRGEPIQARPAGSAERLLRWARRNPAWAALALVSLLAVLLVAGVSAWFMGQLQDSNADLRAALKKEEKASDEARTNASLADVARREEEKQRHGAVEEAKLARRVAYSADIAGMGQFLRERRYRPLRQLLDAWAPGGASWKADDDLRDFAYHHIHALADQSLRALVPPGERRPFSSVNFSADGSLVAAHAIGTSELFWDSWLPQWYPGRIHVWETKTGVPRRLDTKREDWYLCAFSPTGRTLAGMRAGQVVLWDAGTGNVARTLAAPKAGEYSTRSRGRAHKGFQGMRRPGRLLFAPDGKTLALVWHQRVWLWDTADGKQRLAQALGSDPDEQSDRREQLVAEFSPDGAWLALADGYERRDGRPAGVRLFATATGREVATFSGDGAPFAGLAFLHGGRCLAGLTHAFGERDSPNRNQWHAWLVPTPTEPAKPVAPAPVARMLLTRPSAIVPEVLPWPGDQAVVNGDVVRRWQLKADKGTWAWQELPPGRDTPSAGALAAASSPFLATATAESAVMVWRSGQPLTLLGHTEAVTALAFSKDQKMLASGSADGSVRLWSTSTGPLERFVYVDNSWGRDRLLYTPDGRELIFHCMGVIRRFDAKTGREIGILHRRVREDDLLDMALAHDGRRLAYCDRRGGIVILDARSGRVLVRATVPDLEIPGNVRWNGRAAKLAWAKDGSSLTLMHYWQEYQLPYIRRYDISRGKRELVRLDAATGKALQRDRRFVVGLAEDGRTFLVARELPRQKGDFEGEIALEIADLLEPDRVVRCSLPGGVKAFSPSPFSADGKRFAVGVEWYDKKLKRHGERLMVFGLTGKAIHTYGGEPQPDYVSHHVPLAFDGRADRLLVEGGEALYYLNLRTGERDACNLEGDRQLGFSPDGKTFAVYRRPEFGEGGWAPGAAAVHDSATGDWLFHLSTSTGGLGGLGITPRGRRRLLSGGGTALRIRDAESERTLLRAASPRPALPTALALDGKTAYLGTAGGVVSACDAVSGEVRQHLVRHQGPISALCLLDAKTLVSAGQDGLLCWWDVGAVEKGKASLRRLLRAHPGGVAGMTAAKGRVVSVGVDGKACFWGATGTKMLEWPPHAEGTRAVALSPDGTWLATAAGGKEAVIRLWKCERLAEGKLAPERTLKGHKGLVAALDWHPSGRFLASGGEDGTVRLWEAATGAELVVCDEKALLVRRERGEYRPLAPVRGVAFAPDGSYLASTAGNMVRLWDPVGGSGWGYLAGSPAGVLRPRTPHGGVAVGWTPDSRFIVVADAGGAVRRWRMAATDRDKVTPAYAAFRGGVGGVTAVLPTDDGKTVIVGGKDKSVRFWTLGKGLFASKPGLRITGLPHAPYRLALSRDGRALAVACAKVEVRDLRPGDHPGAGVVQVWELPEPGKDGKARLRCECRQQTKFGYLQRRTMLSFSPDGKTLVAAGQADDPAPLWDAHTGKAIPLDKEKPRAWWKEAWVNVPYPTTAFGPQERSGAFGEIVRVEAGEVALAGSFGGAGRMTTFKPPSLRGLGWAVPRPKTHAGLSSDARILAVGSEDDSVTVYAVERPGPLGSWQAHAKAVVGARQSPDGKLAASVDEGGTVKLWRTADLDRGGPLHGFAAWPPKPRFVFASRPAARWLAFSADGKRLAAMVDDKAPLQVWDVSTGKAVPLEAGHRAAFQFEARTGLAGWAGYRLGRMDHGAKNPLGAYPGEWKSPIDGWDLRLNVNGWSDRRMENRERLRQAYLDEVWLKAEKEGMGPSCLVAWSRPPLNTLAVDAKGTLLVTGSADGTLAAWALPPKDWLDPRKEAAAEDRPGALQSTWRLYSTRPNVGFHRLDVALSISALSPDGLTAILALSDGRVRVVSLPDGEAPAVAVHELPGRMIGRPLGYSLSPDGRTLAVIACASEKQGRYAWQARVWDVGSGKQRAVHHWKAGDPGVILYHHKAAVANGGKVLALWTDQTLRLVDLTTDKERRARPLKATEPAWDQVRCLAFSPDGGDLVLAGKDGLVRVWDVAANRERLSLAGHGGAVRWVTHSPDGRTLFSHGNDGVRVWETRTGRPLLTLGGAGNDGWNCSRKPGLVLAPDGRGLIVFEPDDQHGGSGYLEYRRGPR